MIEDTGLNPSVKAIDLQKWIRLKIHMANYYALKANNFSTHNLDF